MAHLGATRISVNLRMRVHLRRKALELKPRRVRLVDVRKAWCILVTCMRNEMTRMPGFLKYYRGLGVQHFLVIDNQSTDGLEEYLANQDDCSLWRAEGSYKASNFGMDWCNYLLGELGEEKWCITVDPDEFLVYPYYEERGLKSLTRYMEGIKQSSLFAPLIDAYADNRLSQVILTQDANPFELCRYFDRFNLTQRYNEKNRNFWVQGGVRMRRFFSERPQDAPALNKVPLVKWKRGLYYVSSMHHLSDPALNCPIANRPLAVSGALFHFKYVNLLAGKASEELARGQHYAGSTEYRAYLNAGDPVLYDPYISKQYQGSSQLTQLGFMQAGGWF